MKTKTTTDTIKNTLRFIGAAVTTGVTCFVFMLMFVKQDEFFALLFNEAVVGLLGLAAGAVVGFIAGAISAYIHTSKEVVEKEHEISNKEKEIAKLQHQLNDAERFVRKLVRLHSEMRKDVKSHRGNDILRQIADLSDEEAPDGTTQEEPASAES